MSDTVEPRESGEASEAEMPRRRDPLDPAQQNISDGTRALEAAYRSREVTLSMMVVGGVVVAALVGVLLALVFF